MSSPKATVITTVFNNREFIRSAIESVLAQTYPNIEYVIKDAGSTDGTLEIIRSYGEKIKLISQKDSGIYDGLNQGIASASGDIITHLNSDDMYASPEIVAHMVDCMEKNRADTGWGDIVFIDRRDVSRIVRRWKSSPYGAGKFRLGWLPPHTSFFVRADIYRKYGAFRTDMRISADYELMLRLLEKNHVSSCYLPETVVKMRHGGTSGKWWSRLYTNRLEDAKAWRVNGLKGWRTAMLMKPISKIPQLFK